MSETSFNSPTAEFEVENDLIAICNDLRASVGVETGPQPEVHMRLVREILGSLNTDEALMTSLLIILDPDLGFIPTTFLPLWILYTHLEDFGLLEALMMLFHKITEQPKIRDTADKQIIRLYLARLIVG